MTEDYKEKLISYITNNLTINSYNATVDGYDIVHEGTIDISMNSNIWNYIAELLLELDRSSIRINGILSINNSSTKVIYGGYSKTDGSNTSEGFLILVDGDYNGITMLRDYESGTRIREVQYLEQDEDNNIYGVVGDTTNDQEQKYFTMLNNFAMPLNNTYYLKLRKNYSLSDTYFRCIDMVKKEGEATYLMVGCDIIDGLGSEENYNGRGIQLTINVGSSNEWTRLYNRGNLPYTCFGILPYFNTDGNPVVKVIAQTTGGDDYTIKIYINQNGTTSVKNGETLEYDMYDSTLYRIRQTKGNNDDLYFQVNYYDIIDYNDKKYCLYHLRSNDSLYKISTASVGGEYCYMVINDGWTNNQNVKNPFYVKYWLTTINGDDRIFIYGYAGTDDEVSISASKWKLIANGTMDATNINYNFGNTLLGLSSNDFNLLSIFTLEAELSSDQPGNYLTTLKRPGLPMKKQDYSEMFNPRYVDVLKDNVIKFSRNIYDSVVYSNTSVDSVQVPYNYLNDIEIQGQNLYGKGNMEFVEDNTTWTKNRYENMDINFINKINVSNRDTSENLLSQAINLNTTIHNDIGTNGGTATIIYNDETFDTVSVSWYQLTQYTYQAVITITPTKDIVSIDWTDSLNGIQFTTNFDTPLASGSSHTIKQKITINNEFYKTNLMYDGVQVQYNGVDVQVQSEEA